MNHRKARHDLTCRTVSFPFFLSFPFFIFFFVFLAFSFFFFHFSAVGLEPCGSEYVCVAEGAGDSYLLLEINAFAFSSSALEVFLSLVS
jgi:hypothetical protein